MSARLIYFASQNLQCCGARVTCSNLPLIYARPLPSIWCTSVCISVTWDARVVVTRVRVKLRCVMPQFALIYARLAPVVGV